MPKRALCPMMLRRQVLCCTYSAFFINPVNLKEPCPVTPMDEGAGSDASDEMAQRPRRSKPKTKPSQPRVTLAHEAAMSRLNRLFKQKANGKYKVPDELLKKWQDDNGKKEIIDEFARSGFDKDTFLASYSCWEDFVLIQRL